MFTQKHALAIGSFISCLLFTQTSSAEPSFAKKYAPYIGYQHGYSTFYVWKEKIDTKYTPRLFLGVSPIQRENYKIGTEIGYTLPITYEDNDRYYDWRGVFVREKTTINVQNADIYLTYYHRLSKNSHLFLKPGLEYYHRSYIFQNFRRPLRLDSYYVTVKAGAGYNINNNLAVNLAAGSRFYDFVREDSRPIKFQFNINAEYTF